MITKEQSTELRHLITEFAEARAFVEETTIGNNLKRYLNADAAYQYAGKKLDDYLSDLTDA